MIWEVSCSSFSVKNSVDFIQVDHPAFTARCRGGKVTRFFFSFPAVHGVGAEKCSYWWFGAICLVDDTEKRQLGAVAEKGLMIEKRKASLLV